MSDVSRTFGNYYRRERDRCENTLADILKIMINGKTSEEVFDALLERLEKHWGREADESAARM